MPNQSNNFPRLETSRLILRAMESADAEAYGELLSDETAYPYITDGGPISSTQIPGRISRNCERFLQGKAIYWALEYQENFIGYVAIHGPTEPILALSYAICRQWRRQGFAAEALDAICRYAFSTLRSQELVARTHPKNSASASLLIKLGFLPTGVVSVTGEARHEFRLTAAQLRNSGKVPKELGRVMLLDPKPIQHSDRVQLAEQLVQRVLAVRGEQVLAIGLYGSLARSTDQPYSDIEMKCVLNTSGEDYSQEWIEDGCKVEVNFESEDVILGEAAMVDEDWAITHGAYFDLKPLYGSDEFFIRLKDALLAPPQESFAEAIREIIVGNILEAIAKLRNSRLEGNTGYLPVLACEIAQQSAFAIGLAHRKCYSTRALVLQESLTFENRPGGHDTLCRMVMAGHLNDFDEVAATLEMLWIGLVKWAESNHFNLGTRCIAPL